MTILLRSVLIKSRSQKDSFPQQRKQRCGSGLRISSANWWWFLTDDQLRECQAELCLLRIATWIWNRLVCGQGNPAMLCGFRRICLAVGDKLYDTRRRHKQSANNERTKGVFVWQWETNCTARDIAISNQPTMSELTASLSDSGRQTVHETSP
ncbi:hypothetical protein J6590_051345 [Homalodisca vitripennis]|nr:hypothetical protein J6590_051345 [Homalodisca vitripennis]